MPDDNLPSRLEADAAGVIHSGRVPDQTRSKRDERQEDVTYFY